MIKKLNIVDLFIFAVFCSLINAQSDKVLLKGECSTYDISYITSFLNERSNIDISVKVSKDEIDEFNNYPIIILCSDGYLKLSELEILSLKSNLLNGSLLIIDNFSSDYTFSIFLKKIMPEYSFDKYPISLILKNNPYRINFENIDLNTKQIFIGEKLRIIAIQNKSLLNEISNQNLDYTKLMANLIFKYLTGG